MFDFVRKHTKLMMSFMFLLIIPAFVLVGVDGFSSMKGRGATVAIVAGKDISQAEWDNAHKIEVDRLRASMPTLDAKMLESPDARYITLERLVRERVMMEERRSAHFTTSNARLARELQQNPAIASLRKADGTLDIERYRQLAASQGLTPEGFEARVRDDLSLRQVESGILTSAFAPNSLSDIAMNAFFERREIQVARFNPVSYIPKIKPSEADLDAFYQANLALFQASETVNIEYAVLDLDSVKKTIVIAESDLKSYYEQNVGRLSGKEERRASHILINAPKDMPAPERQKARERAEALLLQARKSPESFADLARKNSQDPGSAAVGGDLDYFGRGAMVKPFEDAAFLLKKGEISDVVESDFGFHIIRLTDLKTPKQLSFEELRSTIEADLRTQQAQRKFAEAAETFTNAVYEQSDTLKPVAERLKLEVKTASNVQRMPMPGTDSVLSNPKFLEAIFSADSIGKKRNTEVLELGPNKLVSARITEYTAARTLPLADVRDRVRERVVETRSTELARKEGAEKLMAWKADPSSASMPAPITVSRENGQPVQGVLLDAALRAKSSELPAWTGVDLGPQGYAVIRVNKVLPRLPATPEASKQERSQFVKLVANAESQAYYQMLKNRFKVQIKVPAPTGSLIPKQSEQE
jgi:peptidyl-prolyl cis-trans isomerase D